MSKTSMRLGSFEEETTGYYGAALFLTYFLSMLLKLAADLPIPC